MNVIFIWTSGSEFAHCPTNYLYLAYYYSEKSQPPCIPDVIESAWECQHSGRKLFFLGRDLEKSSLALPDLYLYYVCTAPTKEKGLAVSIIISIVGKKQNDISHISHRLWKWQWKPEEKVEKGRKLIFCPVLSQQEPFSVFRRPLEFLYIIKFMHCLGTNLLVHF